MRYIKGSRDPERKEEGGARDERKREGGGRGEAGECKRDRGRSVYRCIYRKR